jgi:hypothetical protein
MESMWMGVPAVVLALVLLPNWVLLVLGVPALMVLSSAGIVQPLLSVRGADIQVSDLVLVLVASRIGSSVVMHRRKLFIDCVHAALAAFLGLLLIATLLAYFRFGSEMFLGEIVALSRLIVQVSVVVLIEHAVRADEEFARVERLLDYGGYVIAATVYLNPWLLRYGISLGEVQVQEEMVRYFGPLGDQVGFMLLYFIFKQLIVHNFLGLAVLGGALVLTGTRGALVALAIGLAVFAWRRHGHFAKRYSGRTFTLLWLVTFVGIAVWYDLGGMRSRFLDQGSFEGSTAQRLLTADIAVRVFADNVLTGVGFTGFRYRALDYGAVKLAIQELGGFAPNFIATAGNQYLQVATDGGVLALASYIWMIFVFCRTLGRVAEQTHGKHGAMFAAGYVWLLSLALGNQFAVWILPGSLVSYLFWLVLGLAVSAQMRGRESELVTRVVQGWRDGPLEDPSGRWVCFS